MADPDTLAISLMPITKVAEKAFAHEHNHTYVEHVEILDPIRVLENDLFPHLAESPYRVVPWVRLKLNHPP